MIIVIKKHAIYTRKQLLSDFLYHIGRTSTVDNPVRLMDAFVDKLDLQKLGFTNTIHKSEGRPPYAPSVLLKLYLYGYLNRIRSSRKLERECLRNIELQWLLQNLQPNYHTIADFRKIHALPLQSMFRLYVQFLSDADLLVRQPLE